MSAFRAGCAEGDGPRVCGGISGMTLNYQKVVRPTVIGERASDADLRPIPARVHGRGTHIEPKLPTNRAIDHGVWGPRGDLEGASPQK